MARVVVGVNDTGLVATLQTEGVGHLSSLPTVTPLTLGGGGGLSGRDVQGSCSGGDERPMKDTITRASTGAIGCMEALLGREDVHGGEWGAPK